MEVKETAASALILLVIKNTDLSTPRPELQEWLMRLELVVWRQVLWLQTPLCSAGPIAAAALHTTWYQQHWRPPTTSPAPLLQHEEHLMLPEYKSFFISISKIWDETYHSRCIRVFPPAEPTCCPWHRAAAAPETWRRLVVT